MKGNDVGMREKWSRAQRLQESLKMAQVDLESTQNGLMLLESQSESFKEVIAKANSLELKLQDRLALSEGKVREL